MHRLALMLCLLLPTATLAQTPPPAVPVGIVVATRQDVTRGAEFVGRVEATQRVALQARVTGFLESVDFKEGGVVHEGDKLFGIEPGPFQAAQLLARGALLQAQAQFANASRDRQRADELVKTSAISVATRDERAATEQSAQGGVISADAALRSATINLSYTTMLAPITGRIGRAAVTRGNVVGPQSGVLATIVSVDPIYVTFPVSERDFLRIRREHAEVSATDLQVRVLFADGIPYAELGRINFLDVSVDRGTDTLTVRATVANPKGDLVDGQFVRLRVEGTAPAQSVVVPQSALLIDQEGAYVFVVEAGHAVVRRLRTGQEVGRGVVVEQGLQGGEQVVVEGLVALRPGAAVLASPARGI